MNGIGEACQRMNDDQDDNEYYITSDLCSNDD